jgi:hypothetical protein
MSGNRLLIDIEVLEFLRTCKRKEQEDLLKRFREIATYPSSYSDFAEYDSTGRRVDVHIHAGFAIKFWDDFADRHVKILEVHSADLS